MATAATAYDDLQRTAAKRFLQTALIVDDNASTAPELEGQTAGEAAANSVREPGGPLKAEVTPAPPARDPGEGETGNAPTAQERAAAEINDRTGRQRLAAATVDVKTIADGFAEETVTCGILKPAPGEDPETITERIVNAATNVDLVVLDWVLGEDQQGREITARNAIRRIVEADRRGRRLITIYTSQRDVDAIFHDVGATLGVNEDQLDLTTLSLVAGGTQVIILHKGGPNLEPGREDLRVPGSELPRQLIQRFARLAEGLVPAVALHALAATRANTHLLLSRLSAELDLGYIGHLLRLAHRSEGEQHLIDALSGELRAVIEDDQLTREAAATGSDAWLAHYSDRLTLPADVLWEIGGVLDDDSARDRWINRHKGQLPGGKLKEEDITELIADEDNAGSARLADARFAQLLSMRHRYERPEPELHLGTIVQEQSSCEYYLCLQPVCDSVRLDEEDGPRNFLMLPLMPVDHSTKGQRAHFVINGEDGGPVHLYSRGRSYDMRLIPMMATEQGVVRFRSSGSGAQLTVRTSDGRSLCWVAQLKPSHAQRVADDYGANLTRVGLDESEWMRRRAKSGKVAEQPLLEKPQKKSPDRC